jgi:1-acyl-sn-glycerol-3-phosphate acyltransferase
MAVDGVRRRKGPAAEIGHGTIGKIGVQHVGDYGTLVQIIRSLVILSTFIWTCICICVTQLIGAPLYFIDRNYFNSFIAMTKRSFGIAITALTEWASPTPVRVSGDKSVQGQVALMKNGRLKHCFPERLVLIANHQVYTDWLYLWWVGYTNLMHGHIYIILKESLKYIPMIGTGMMFYGFVFMARKWQSDKPRLQHRLQKLNAIRPGSSPKSPAYDPMWLLIFPEGTNLSPRTKKASEAYAEKQGLTPFKHVLLPRSTGLFFCLQQLRGSVDWVYDCTIGYDGHP